MEQPDGSLQQQDIVALTKSVVLYFKAAAGAPSAASDTKRRFQRQNGNCFVSAASRTSLTGVV